jgi:hypothetical protein
MNSLKVTVVAVRKLQTKKGKALAKADAAVRVTLDSTGQEQETDAKKKVDFVILNQEESSLPFDRKFTL